MKKKRLLILVPVLLLALILLWPHSFPGLTAGDKITIQRIDLTLSPGEDGRTHPDMDTHTSTSSALSTRTLVQTVLDRYYFRVCPLRTLFANGALDGNKAGYWLHIYGNDSYLSTGGTGYVMMDDMIYHVGLFGNRQNLALMEDLSAILFNEPV